MRRGKTCTLKKSHVDPELLGSYLCTITLPLALITMTPSPAGTKGSLNGVAHHTHTNSFQGFSTRAIHVGSEPSEDTGAVIPAISLSTTYKQKAVGDFKVSSLVCTCS